MKLITYLKKFDDPRRKKIRARNRWHFLTDFFFTSESTDYLEYRFVFNLFFGLCVSASGYKLWEKINFATHYHPVPQYLFQVTMILGNAFAFAYSRSYRAGLFVFILGFFGSIGQNMLTIFLSETIRQGPIDNIVANFRIATDNVVCGVRISTSLASIRTKALIGPMRETLQRELSRALEWKNQFNGLKCDGGCPQDEAQETEEDKLNRMIDQSALDLAQRAKMSNYEEGDVKFKKPFYTKFKQDFVRKMGLEMQEQCTQIFDKGTLVCHKAFTTLKEKCRSNTPFLLTGLICKPLDALQLCEEDKRKEDGFNVCNSVLGNNLPQGFEQESIDMRNISKQIAEEMETKIRIAKHEAPRVSSALHIKTLQAKVRHIMDLAKEVVKSAQTLLGALLVFIVYLTFNRGLKMVDDYTKDLAFENRCLSRAFWEIDMARAEKKQKEVPFLGRMTVIETKQLKLTSKFLRIPKWKELKLLWLPCSKFFAICVVAFVIIAFDHIFYRFLLVVVNGIPKDVNQTNLPSLHFKIKGVGLFPRMLNNLFKVKNTSTEPITVLEDCLLPPSKPNYGLYALTILMPLAFMLIFQIALACLPKRVILYHFLPFMFPRRNRARVIWLYNECLKHRLDARKEARRRISFFVKWRSENDYEEEEDICFCFPKDHYMRRKVINNLFKMHQCLLCDSHMHERDTYACKRCQVTYCKYCWTELESECYACKLEKDETTKE